MNTYEIYRANADNYDRDILIKAASTEVDGCMNLKLRGDSGEIIACFAYGHWSGWRLVPEGAEGRTPWNGSITVTSGPPSPDA